MNERESVNEINKEIPGAIKQGRTVITKTCKKGRK